MTNDTFFMLKRLADAPGACAFEDEVVAVAREYAAHLGTLEEDCLRNLYIHRKENTGDRPVVMLDAHTDEVGMMIHSIKPNGTLRFLPLGSWNKGSVAGTKVLVRNRHGEYIPGIVASKPVHFQSAAEKAAGLTELEDMVIDVGAVSAQDAVENFGVRIGEPVVPAYTTEYDAKRDIIFGKAFDDRIGCAALLEVLRRLEGVELPCDVVGVLSTQEELGLRSAKVTVNRVRPAAAVVLEGCPADDTYGSLCHPDRSEEGSHVPPHGQIPGLQPPVPALRAGPGPGEGPARPGIRPQGRRQQRRCRPDRGPGRPRRGGRYPRPLRPRPQLHGHRLRL